MKAFTWLVCLLVAGGLLATPTPQLKQLLSGNVQFDGEPLEYATVSAFGPDSTLMDGTLTDVNGRFELRLPAGPYRLMIEFIGLQAQELDILLSAPTELPAITLTASNVRLETVEVRAQKSQLNLQLDKKVFNVGNDALAQGGSATNVLEQLPSVEVSVEGQVSLRGNASVKILINGRPSALADNNALESIPAENIESVEIITNPSARYEAAGSAGIINIILKKGIEQGYGGTINLTTGMPNNHRIGGNLNLRRDKFNAFGSVGLRLSNYRGSGDLTRTSQLTDNFSELTRSIDMRREDRNVQAFGGLDYFLNDKTTFTFSYSLYYVVNDDVSQMDFDLFADNRVLTESWKQTLDYLEPATYQQIDFSLVKKMAREGERLTLYFKNDLGREREQEATTLNAVFPADAELLRYRTSTAEGNRDHLLQADYERQLGEHANLEIGARGETRVISADYLAEIPEQTGWQTIPGFENDFDYYERIGTLYAQYRWKKDRFGLQLGLRNEYTEVRVENESENLPDFTKRYNRLFPSLSAQYELSESSSWQLTYSKRIRRPSFWQLNPFAGIENPTRLFQGNPDIDPSYTDRVELTYLLRKEKITFNPSFYLSTATDFFASYYTEEAENLFQLNSSTLTEFPLNLIRENVYGIEVNTSYRPADGISLNATFNYFGYTQRGSYLDQDYDFDFASWSGRLRSNIDLGKTTQLTATVNYRAASRDAQQLRAPQILCDFGGSKRWGNRITLSANVRSPRYFESTVQRPGFSRSEYFQWTGWRASLSFQYRFEQGAAAGERRQRGSIR